MGQNRRKRRQQHTQLKREPITSNTPKLYLERLEERWLLDSTSLVVEDPFAPNHNSLSSLFQHQLGALTSGVYSLGTQDGFATGADVGALSRNVPWEFEGPSPLEHQNNASGVNLAPNFGGGAIEAIAPHPSNPQIVYVGTVAGGIWRTLTADQSNPFWEALTDQQRSLNISSIAFSPVDINADGTFK